MTRLADSISLQMDAWTLHAQLATDDGYVASLLDLTDRIGNVKGRFVVGEEWRSNMSWRRWASRPFRGTIMTATLRDDENPGQLTRDGHWIDGEID